MMRKTNKAKTLRLPDVGRPPPHMTCIWWTHPKRMTAMAGRIRLTTSLLRHLQSVDVSGAAQNRVAKKTAISAPERTTLRRMPKTPKPLSSQHPNMMIGRMGKLTLTIQSGTRTQRIVTTYQYPKRTRASAMKISSCQRNPLNKNALSTG